MASGGEDLRRRPVHPEKVPLFDREVEISEVEEDAKQPHPLLEDDLDDDPLVLKGSRPTGPPKKLAEGEEDWGIDDDDDWGSKRDPSQPRKETQEQRIQRVMEKGVLEIAVAVVFHLAALGFYVYAHVHDGTIYKKTGGKGFPGSDTFGGRWKFLTYIDLWSQFVYFFLAFLNDVMPMSPAKLMLAKFCDFIFTTVVFPLALFVVIAFWGIYAIDRELVYPVALDEFVPPFLNHCWHTFIGVGVFLEVLLVFHRYPPTSKAVTTVFTYSTAYIIWLVVILTVDNFWVYPFLRVMPPPVISVFFAASFFLAVGLYFFGKILGNWRWRERHTLIDELRV
jgi:hypothetical protein